MNFDVIFKDIMIENDTNVQQVSKNTGIDDSHLYNYLHGALPEIRNAVKLANEFNCSINYLMGLDEEPHQTKFDNTYDISLFSNRYDDLLKEHNITHYKLYREKRLNYSSHYAWQHGAEPAMSSLIIIAQYFDVSIDYLVGRTNKK